MTQQATALIKFKHCNFAEHYAAAKAAYDSNPQTAWLSSFTIAQKAYWSAQPVDWLPYDLISSGATLAGSHLFNSYAADLATQRDTAINNAANSAFNTCMAGGASSSPASVVEPGFSLIVQTKLDGSSSSIGTMPTSGPSALLSVAFSATVQELSPLDWRSFYRLGAVVSAYISPSMWGMAYTGSSPYSGPILSSVLPMRTGIQITIEELAPVTGRFEQCLPYPLGYMISEPSEADLIASFDEHQMALTFQVSRHVLMPDGEMYTYTVDCTAGGPGSYDLTFPSSLSVDCDVSGTVYVRHAIHEFAVNAEYTLNSDIQKIQIDSGTVHDMPILIHSGGSRHQWVGDFPDSYRYIQEQFAYITLSGLRAVRVSFYDLNNNFQWWLAYLLAPAGAVPTQGMDTYSIYGYDTGGYLMGYSPASGSTLHLKIYDYTKADSQQAFYALVIEDHSARYQGTAEGTGYKLSTSSSHVFNQHVEVGNRLDVVIHGAISLGWHRNYDQNYPCLSPVPDFPSDIHNRYYNA